MSDSMPELIAARFLHGLRVAMVALLFVLLFGWQLPTVIGFRSGYRSAGVEFASLGVLGGVCLVAGIVVARDRPWGRLRWPLLLITLAVIAAATAAVGPGDLFGPPHWSWETFGWYAVVLLLDLPMPWFASVLAAFLAITLGQMVLVGQHDQRILIGMIVTALVLACWQFAVAAAAGALQRTAMTASRIAAEEEVLRTAEQVARALHRDRQARYADLLDSTVPLLAGLANGELDPDDPVVRRACMIEAARMRRLFAESDVVVDPLEHELNACIDLAERRGVTVQLALRGTRPALPLPVRRALTEPVIAVLAGARARARVTVVGVDDRVVVSVVADQNGPVAAAPPVSGLADISMLTGDDGVWLDATWKLGA